MRSKRRRELACPERGGGCECNEQTEGLYRGFCCFRQPLSQSALRRIASSPSGEPFWCALQTPAQLRRAANDGPYSAHYKPLAKTRGRTASHIFTISYVHPPQGGFHMAEPYFTLRRQYFTALWRNFTAGISPLISFPLPLRWSRRGSR